MTREQAQREREAFNAFCDGAEIQERPHSCGTWTDTNSPLWAESHEHRIKPVPEMKMVPLRARDVKPGDVFRNEGWTPGAWAACLGAYAHEVPSRSCR